MSLKPIYTQPYNELVQPDVVWTASKYFIRRWPAYLSPRELWLVVGARQLSYYNNKLDWFEAYDAKLANEAKVSLSLFQHQMKPQIFEGTGPLKNFLSIKQRPSYERFGEVTRQTETTYQIRRDDPLTPADAAYLSDWLRRNAPSRVTPKSLKELLEDAYKTPSREFWSPTPNLPAAYPGRSVADVVESVFGVETKGNKDREWQSAADALHQHITEAQTLYIDTQYFRQAWLPKLKHGAAWLLVFLRSFTYRDGEGHVRDEVDYYAADVQRLFGVKDSKTMRSWVSKLDKVIPEPDRQPFPQFVELLEKKKEADGRLRRTFKVTIDDPLTKKDLQAYWDKVGALSADEQGGILVDEKIGEIGEIGVVSVGGGKKDSHGGFVSGNKSSHENDSGGNKSRDAFESNGKNSSDSLMQNGNKSSHIISQNGKKDSHENQADRKKYSHIMSTSGDFHSDTPGGEGNFYSTWAEKLQANKYYKQFFSLTGNKKTLLKTISTVTGQQATWKAESGRADFAFAVVAVADLRDFLSLMEIFDQRGAAVIRRSGWSAVQAVAWYLWGTDQSWMKNLGGYMIQRARERAEPPVDYEALAELPWALWRVYALYWQMPVWLRPSREQMSQLPMFEAWSLIYADRPLEALPFDVGEGIAAVVQALPQHDPAEQNGGTKVNAGQLQDDGADRTVVEPAAGEGVMEETVGDAYAARWAAALAELELQMTRATFDAWLRHTAFVRFEDGVYIVSVQNQRAKEWLDARLKPMVERTLTTLTGEGVGLRVVVGGE